MSNASDVSNINSVSNRAYLNKCKLSKGLKPVLILALALSICLFPFNTAIAQQADSSPAPEIIHESSTSYTLTSGATYENIRRFTTEGWLNINVIRIDMTNPYIKLDAMANIESIQKLTSVPSLALSKNAVGAINGGFFNWSKIPGLNSPIGPMVESGTIRTSSSDFNRYSDSMATFAVDNMNQIFYGYWKTDINLITENNTVIPVARYNVQLNDNGDLIIIDNLWSNTSIGRPDKSLENANNSNSITLSDKYTDIVEMVVENNQVVEIRKNLPPVEIPSNGYVAVAANSNIKLILDNFKEGDTIEMEVITKPDWDNISMAITGGAIILEDGSIPTSFSHNSPGRHPRTAIGSSKDGDQVIMVTVDGRQQSSLGMTLTELASLMLELGAHNAINLDGGGSTTMVARRPGTRNVNVVNNPSDGMPRKVGNAVGVISTAPSSPLEGLIIDTEDKNVFVNTSRSYTVRGYDKYFNPVEVDPDKVKWSISGLEGDFKDNTFYPTSVGSGKIIATIEDVSGEIFAEHEINSLSSPVQLILNEKLISVQVNGKKKFTVIGKNKNGYYAKINSDDVQWKVSADIGIFEGDTFIATSEGKGYIEVSVGDTKAYCGVKTAADIVVITDDFEKTNGTYLSYPADIPGKYELSSEQKRSGKYSGKLTYDFNDSTGSRASYLLFSDGGYELGKNVQKIGIWVYNPSPNPNWLRALIYDSQGERHYIDFTQNMDWTGWKYVEASLSGINKKPLKLARIYLVQIRDVPDAGSIYLDDLTFVSVPDPQKEDIEIPEDTVPIDEDNRNVVYQKDENEDYFRFSVFSQSGKVANPLERLLLFRLTNKINSYIDAAVFIGNNSSDTAKKVGKPALTVNNEIKSLDIKNSKFIQLNTSKQGLRLSNPVQWKWFKHQLDYFEGDNIFICLTAPFQQFSDKLEAELFQDILTDYRQKTGRNVWVFYKSDKNANYMERGIKYISTAGLDIEDLDPSKTDLVQYILVTVKGKEVTFQFKPIVP
jgi:exopolysaccharide biosynthesis protein